MVVKGECMYSGHREDKKEKIGIMYKDKNRTWAMRLCLQNKIVIGNV